MTSSSLDRILAEELASVDDDDDDELMTLDSSTTGETDGPDPIVALDSTTVADATTIADEGHEVVERGEGFPQYKCEMKGAHWICQPYKREILQQQLDANAPGSSRRAAVIGTLRDMGVKVFIIDGTNVSSTKEILKHIKRVIGFVARENQILQQAGGFQRCLLYQDKQGRLFNLLLSQHAVGPASKWHDYLDSFSGLEAMVALTVLARSFPCAMEDAQIESLQPAYLSLILGLVLTEEISLSWLNASMFIRATPSVSAHTLTTSIGSDLLRKSIVLCLALAGAATGTMQKLLTLAGIGAACTVLLANLGARSWHFMGWRPIRYTGKTSGFWAYLAAIATGIALPYMGHRNISIGGKAAMEYVLKTAFIVAVVFVLSDFDELQKFLIVGSEACNQDMVNIVVGGWWTFGLLSSLFMVRRIPYRDQHPNYDGEPLLVEDHASPVGFKVPDVPDFVVDPSLSKTGSALVSIGFEMFIGLLMAAVIGGGIIYLAFTSWGEDLVDSVQESLRGDMF